MTDDQMVFAPIACALCALSNRPAPVNTQYLQTQPKERSLRQQAAARLEPPVDPALFKHLSTAELCKLSKRQNKVMEQIFRECDNNQVITETEPTSQDIASGDGPAPQANGNPRWLAPISGHISLSPSHKLSEKAKAAVDKKYNARRARAESKYNAKCERIEMDHRDETSPKRRAKQIKLDEKHEEKMTTIDLKSKKKLKKKQAEVDRVLRGRCNSAMRQLFISGRGNIDNERSH